MIFTTLHHVRKIKNTATGEKGNEGEKSEKGINPLFLPRYIGRRQEEIHTDLKNKPV